MEEKIRTEFIIRQYQSGIDSYYHFAKDVGLWESEKYTFLKYLHPSFQILDIGCGAGRTTHGMHQYGFKNIVGLDITPEMVDAAESLNEFFQHQIPFVVGDCCQLDFEDQAFDAVVFSFNGIMSIPAPQQRKKALQEIWRVLKPEGVFIFTTHDRDEDPRYSEFWKAEEQRWAKGQQRKELYIFGDLITRSKNESREIFIHIPDQSEMKQFIANGNFQLLETFYRSDKFTEPKVVQEKSGECRFWVVRKD